MKPSSLTLAFLVVFMMAIMYNSVQAEALADADAEAFAEAGVKELFGKAWGLVKKHLPKACGLLGYVKQ
uniref:U-poneritoxin(01)-Om4a n=1 Tax=Odontomachus monticola TaxID=613454 RepID=TX14A_ODOMO|nr:RecName: Full=U-poneritoxin(01)-Om4a; Short=U-PONTX(01)-Om4a; AltName: Full=Pilosulin-like peptide 4; Short=PLP4; AltName: Full=Poneratoxin; Flags: Precursor [Odontomachus monticola]